MTVTWNDRFSLRQKQQQQLPFLLLTVWLRASGCAWYGLRPKHYSNKMKRSSWKSSGNIKIVMKNIKHTELTCLAWWLIQLFKILQQKSILNCFNQSVTCDANVKWSFNVICKRAKYLTIFLQNRNSKIEEEEDGSNVRCKQWKPRRSFRSEQGEIFFTNKNFWIFVPVFYFEVSKVCQLLSMCLFHWRKNNGAFHCIQWSIHQWNMLCLWGVVLPLVWMILVGS